MQVASDAFALGYLGKLGNLFVREAELWCARMR